MGSTKMPVVGGILGFLFSIGSSLGTDWGPKVFGDWYRREIAKLLEDEKKPQS